MALQGVSHFKDIAYAPGISYGEAFGQAEYEMSRYYLDDADIAANQALFETYAAEARRLIDARLPVPAHAYVLKCSPGVQRAGRARRDQHHRAGPGVRPHAQPVPRASPNCGPSAARNSATRSAPPPRRATAPAGGLPGAARP